MTFGLAFVVAAAIVALPVSMASAAAGPANDSFAAAQVVSGPSGSTSASTVGASSEVGEPSHAGQAAAASVWFSWTPSSSGQVVFDTCGSDFDTVLAVYTGAVLVALSSVASNDDACGTQSKIQFAAVASTTYSIVVDGFLGDTGTLTLAWSPPATAPANDQFANAATITGAVGTINGTTVAATSQATEPLHGGVPSVGSVWYSYTPTSTGTLTLDTCTNTLFDSVIAVYTGSAMNALTSVGANDDLCGSQSLVTVQVTGGIVYRIAVVGVATDTGSFALRWSRTNNATPGPVSVTETFAGDGWVSAAWDMPQFAGTTAIVSYTLIASPGGASVVVNGPGTRGLITGLTNNTSYTLTVTAANSAGVGTASPATAPVAPVAGPVDITTNYDVSEVGRMQQTATYFGSSVGQAQHDCVGVIAFILGLIPPGATPIAPPPSNLGATAVTSTWPTAEQQFIVSVSRKYGFSPQESQKFSTQLVGFLLALGGH